MSNPKQNKLARAPRGAATLLAGQRTLEGMGFTVRSPPPCQPDGPEERPRPPESPTTPDRLPGCSEGEESPSTMAPAQLTDEELEDTQPRRSKRASVRRLSQPPSLHSSDSEITESEVTDDEEWVPTRTFSGKKFLHLHHCL